MARTVLTQPTVLDTYGDSISLGFNSSSAPVSYSGLIGTNTGWSVTNHGIAGTQIQDQLVNNFGKNVSELDQLIYITGYNDMRHMGTDATQQATYQNCLYSSAVFHAIPRRNKVLSRDGGIVTYTGTVGNSGILGGNMFKSLNAAATASFFVSGTVLYIVCAKDNVGTANKNIQVSVDGIDKGTFSCTDGTATQSGTIYSAFLIRITGLSSGQHSVVLTAGAGAAWFGFASGNGYVNAITGPYVYLGNCLKMTTTGYATGSAGFTNGSDTAVGQFNTLIQAVSTTLLADGLNVIYCDISSVYVPSTMEDTDHIHPTDAGHLAIGNKFITYLVKSVSRTPVNVARTVAGARSAAVVTQTLVADTFDRANSTTNLGSTDTGNKLWTQQFGTWGISSNKAYVSTPLAGNNISTFDAGIGDYTTFQMTLNMAAGGSGGNVFRFIDTSNYLFARISETADTLLLVKTDGGAGTTFATVSVTILANTNYVLNTYVVGSSIRVYLDTVLLISYNLTGGDATKFSNANTLVGMRQLNATAAITFDALTIQYPDSGASRNPA